MSSYFDLDSRRSSLISLKIEKDLRSACTDVTFSMLLSKAELEVLDSRSLPVTVIFDQAMWDTGSVTYNEVGLDLYEVTVYLVPKGLLNVVRTTYKDVRGLAEYLQLPLVSPNSMIRNHVFKPAVKDVSVLVLLNKLRNQLAMRMVNQGVMDIAKRYPVIFCDPIGSIRGLLVSDLDSLSRNQILIEPREEYYSSRDVNLKLFRLTQMSQFPRRFYFKDYFLNCFSSYCEVTTSGFNGISLGDRCDLSKLGTVERGGYWFLVKEIMQSDNSTSITSWTYTFGRLS